MPSERVAWLKPDQIDQLRDACYAVGWEQLQERNEAIICVFADCGLRSKELVGLETQHINFPDRKLFLPVEIQKAYGKGSPDPSTLSISRDTSRTLKKYLRDRWTDSTYLFPNRTGGKMSTRGLRKLVNRLAEQAELHPQVFDSQRGWVEGDPEDVSTHTFRHSVAYRMLEVEDGHDIYDVQRRLRHKQLQTTIDTYAHFETA